VRLVIELPVQMEAVAEGTRARVRATFPQRRIVFEPVTELRAGEPLSFDFQTEAKQSGSVSVVAEVSSDHLRQPVRAAEQTEILGR